MTHGVGFFVVQYIGKNLKKSGFYIFFGVLLEVKPGARCMEAAQMSSAATRIGPIGFDASG
jgi:hypothetical protein